MSLLSESRYDRQERISWWDQSLLRAGKILVVGAGALGNELVKNLSLLGIGEIHVVDMDLIEHTNLARCVFFKEGDEKKPKAEVLAKAAQALNSDVKVVAHVSPVQFLGSGFLTQFDAVLGGLDNREARLWVNRACRRLGIFWVDGAIEGLHGVVQSFWRDGACYECTLTEVDWKILSHRRSCALLGVVEMQQGKTPTNATTASVVAAVQVQEIVKFLVKKNDLLALIGKQWTILGESMLSFVTSIDQDESCLAHEEPSEIAHELVNPENLRVLVEKVPGEEFVALDLNDDLLTISPCAKCNTGGVTGIRSLIGEGEGVCKVCGENLVVFSRTSINADDPVLDISFSTMVWSKCELVFLRTAEKRIGALVWSEK
jgi:adenylyltransferase/sulfurtransferase